MALSEFTKTLKSADQIEITVTGRSSGRKVSNIVWFVQDGKKLYLLPVKGSDSDWYKNVLKNAAVGLAARGTKWNAKATPISDASVVRDIVEKFRAKYGADEVKKYYSKFDAGVEVPLA